MSGVRRILEVAYNRLGYPARESIYRLGAKLFRDEPAGFSSSWRVRFLSACIEMPLRRDWMWLDWDSALSILGHETSVKSTYERLIRIAWTEVFVDVGANYGLHTLLHSSNGVDCIAIEPNAECRQVLSHLLDLNALSATIVPAAAGSYNGTAQLESPVRETWLGKVTRGVTASEYDDNAVVVDVVQLDEFVAHLSGRRTLIKIDAEGGEFDILLGAVGILKNVRPLVVFESVKGRDDRGGVFELLRRYRFVIRTLPMKGGNLDDEVFRAHADSNFIALPEESLRDPGCGLFQ